MRSSWLGKKSFGHRHRDSTSTTSTTNPRDDTATDGTYGVQYRPNISAIGRAEDAVHITDPRDFIKDFFDAHQDTFGSKSMNIADIGLDMKSIEDSLNGFSDSARTIIKGLTALGHVHPFIEDAVGAFALVVALDLTRRDNDRKALAVKVQMQELMKVFFELRHVPSSSEGPDGLTVAERLEELVHQIAKDIKACGSACDAYLKKGFLAKNVKASVYENRLSSFVTTFMEHRSALELLLKVHTSLGIDSANDKLDYQGNQLQIIDQKLDMLLLFRKLDTPRERDIQKFIEAHGGAKACISDEVLLEELLSKSGESLSRFSGRDAGRRSNGLHELRKRLLKELQEDIDEVLTRNMVLFERKLDIQSKQLSEIVQDEADYIINTVLSGAHDRITDPDMQTVWKDMGWKGSVKARHFVLALHDYYSDQLSSTESPQASHISGLPSPETPTRSSFLKRHDDRWALTYINAAYVQSILEAVDDDGTGFISVKEVNTFVAERPENWSLPHWIAYWAAGWQSSMTHYKEQIYELVQTMFQILEYVLPSNRRAVDEYLFHPSFWRIELLLRSTRSVSSKILSDPDLSRMTEAYERYEEERLDANLRDVAYELDTPATVSLITGAGRIERYIFPLIYLLLRRHLKVMRLACKHVIDVEEFVTLNESLVSILLAVDHRIENLEAIFKQTNLDVQARLGNFAFGIYQLSYGDIKRKPADNSFATWTDPTGEPHSTSSNADAQSLAEGIPNDILKYGIQDGYSVTDYYEFETTSRVISEYTQIEGTWTGHYRRRFGDEWVQCILRLSIRLASQPKIVGKGEDFASAFGFMGLARSHEKFLDFSFIVDDEDDGTSRTCTGRLDRASNTISAQWQATRRDGGPDDGDEPFALTRTPPSLLRYKYTPQQFREDPARSRWAFACSSALHQAQAMIWSRRFFEARFRKRKQYVELTTRDLIVQQGLTPQEPLTQVEKGVLEYLRHELDPSEARFYQALSDFEIQKLPWHPTWGCDGCDRQITKSRILCIECMSDDLSDNIDLCISCVGKTPTRRGFTHDLGHAVLKVQRTLHDYHIAGIVGTARTTLERTKIIFRSLDPGTALQHSSGIPNIASSRPCCAFCRKDIFLPCWVCVAVPSNSTYSSHLPLPSGSYKDIFICTDCDTEPTPGVPENRAHALVYISNATLPGDASSSDDRNIEFERRLHALEERLAEQFLALEARENERFASLEAQVTERLRGLERRIEGRLEGLDAVLKQIARQTAPAVSGQVQREYIPPMR
ncbi:hypothetical protein C0991_006448 [Blastosporella zonata]|nr:hypothetical protein C0991_006448 [Blastosporella zonata]